MTSVPKIERIATETFRLPLKGSLRWGASSRLDALEHVEVRVRLSDGSVGVAEAPPRPTIYGETVASILAVIEQELLPRVVGLAAEPERVWRAMAPIKNNHTARGAIDLALHQAIASGRSRSLVEHLSEWSGLALQERIRVSYILGLGETAQLVEEAQGVFDRGVRVLKVKVSAASEDLDRLDALRSHFGDALALYVDANETLDEREALGRLAAFHERGALFCEEPIPIERLGQRSELRRLSPLPLIADDSCFSPRDLERELEANTFDVLNIKTARSGFTESLAMLRRAREAGKRVMVGSQAGSAVGAHHAAAFAALEGVDCPSEVSFHLKLEHDRRPPLVFEEGWLDVASLERSPD